MKSKQYLKIAEHYENCLRKFGDNHRGVDWPNAEDARLRYDIMLGIIPSGKNCTLLDFGCGTAHLYDHILKRNYNNIKYSGLDISEEFIRICKTKYPDQQFDCIDVLLQPEYVKQYDYIILNGIFTEKLDLSYSEMFEFFSILVKTIFSKSKFGIAFNVMTKHVDWERKDLFHLPFDELATFLKNEVSKNFIIRNDYGLFEYTVYLFKEPNSWHV
ncbi:MAG: class I SAM-dependent methyltransferase [Bacteroidales bacterium]|nr:class I SAM-dependent methyltransferase [Bacteroidales bacterium]